MMHNWESWDKVGTVWKNTIFVNISTENTTDSVDICLSERFEVNFMNLMKKHKKIISKIAMMIKMVLSK